MPKLPPHSPVVVYLRPVMYAGCHANDASKKNRELKVVFVDAIGTAECTEIINQLKQDNISHVLFVASNIPARLNQDLDQLSLHVKTHGLRFEVFEAGFFLFDKMQTDIMQRCYPEPMSLEESQKWLQNHKLQPEQLLQYVPRDFVVRYFGLVPGQIVRIRGPNVTKFRIYHHNPSTEA